MDRDTCVGGRWHVGGRSRASVSALTAARVAQSLRCSMRIHQESVQVCAYRLIIAAQRESVWGGVVCAQASKGAHLTNASLSSGDGSGPPKPPLTRHRLSSSEWGACGQARGGGGAERVSPIDP